MLGVIGPTRMAYERVIPVVQAAADVLGRGRSSPGAGRSARRIGAAGYPAGRWPSLPPCLETARAAPLLPCRALGAVFRMFGALAQGWSTA